MKLNLHIIFSILFLGFILFIYSLYQRIPHDDDAWIGEQVYWLNESGIVKNVLLKNFNDNQNGLIVYHKAFVYNGLWLVKMFGFSLYILKLVSLLYLFLFFVIFYYYLIKLRKLLIPIQFLWVILFFLIEPHIFEYAYVFRPEIMLMTTGFLSYIFLEQSIDKKDKKYLIIMAAVFSGVSILVHLNGAIFVVAGGIVLIILKKIKSFLVFVLVNIIFVYLYFSHMESLADILKWAQQILSYDTGKVEVGLNINTIINTLIKVTYEHLRFFHSPKEIFVSILLIVATFISYRDLKTKTPTILPFTVVLMLCLGLLVPSKTAKYLIPLLPFFAIIVISAMSKVWKVKPSNKIIIPLNTKSISLFVALLLFILSSFSYDIYLSSQKFDSQKYHNITKKYIKMPTQEVTILAPMLFIFDEIINYNEIIGLISFNERSKTDSRMSGAQFFKLTEEENIDYIILNNHYINKFNIDINNSTHQLGNYYVVGFEDDLTILEHRIENINDRK